VAKKVARARRNRKSSVRRKLSEGMKEMTDLFQQGEDSPKKKAVTGANYNLGSYDWESGGVGTAGKLLQSLVNESQKFTEADVASS